MRLSIFIGLLYIAWCINPETFDSIQYKFLDLVLIGIVFILAFIADIKDILTNNKSKL